MASRARTRIGRSAVGSLAAWYLAAAYVAAMPYFLVVVDYPGAESTREKVDLLLAHHGSLQVMYLFTYVVFGVVLATLALVLHERLAPASPEVMRTATVAGVLWGGALVASGLVINAGVAAVVDEHAASPDHALAVWRAVEPVALGLGGAGGELLGGLWVLLVSLAARRSLVFSRRLVGLGAVVGSAGVLSVVSPLRGAAIVFGLLQIVWFVWVGIAMRQPARAGTGADHAAAALPDRVGVASAS